VDWHRGPGTGEKAAAGVAQLLARAQEELGGPLLGARFLYDARQMLAATREIERAVSAPGTTLYVGFQRADKLDGQARTYRHLTGQGVQVIAFGTGTPTEVPEVRWVGRPEDHGAVANQWFLVTEAPEPIGFVGFETSPPDRIGQGGAVDDAAGGDRRRDRPGLCRVPPSRPGPGPARGDGGGAVGEPVVHLGRLLERQSDPGGHQRQDQVRTHDLLGKGAEPASHGHDPPAVDIGDPMAGDQLGDLGDVASGDGMVDGFLGEPRIPVPNARPVALRRRGWRITYLGTDSPIGAVADTSRTLTPAVVVLFSINPQGFLDHAPEIAQLATQVPVMIAGTGATPQVARQTHTRVLEQDPVSAAAIIDRDHSAPR